MINEINIQKNIKNNLYDILVNKMPYILSVLLAIFPIFLTIVRCIFPSNNNFNIIAKAIVYPLLIISFLAILSMIILLVDKILKNGFIKTINIIKNKRFILYFVIFFIISFISCLVSKDKKIAFIGYSHSEFQFGFVTYLSYIGFFFLGYILDEKQRQKVINLIIFVGVYMCFTAVFQSFLLPAKETYRGPFSQFNHFAYYLTILLAIVSGKIVTSTNNKYIFLYSNLFVLILHVLIINNTFSCILSFMFSIIALTIIFNIRKKSFKSFLPLILFYSYLLLMLPFTWNGLLIDFINIFSTSITSNEAGTGRMGLWKYAFDMISKKPLLGYGCEGMADKYWYYYNVTNSLPHNEYLQIAGFFGIPALILYLLALLFWWI